jgi:hypothetical protein
MKKLLIPIVIVVLLLLAGGGGYYYLSSLKSSLKPDYAKQITSLQSLRTKVDQVTVLYQEGTSNNSDTKTGVLGASVSKDPKANVSKQVGQVLGIEDNQNLKRSRDIVEVLTQASEELTKISSTNTSISNNPGLALLKTSFGVKAPTESTAKMVADIAPILDVLKKEEDLGIRAYSTGYDLGASLQLALMRADEESIKKLEAKISDLEKLSDEEKALTKLPMPAELKAIFDKTSASTEKTITQFKDIPDIIRKKDLLALQKKVATMLVDTSGDSVKNVTDLITFLRSNAALRSIDTVKEEWSAASKTL